MLSIDKGTGCSETENKWHFDLKTDTCYPFDYTGCGSSEANRFETESECSNNCNTAQYMKNKSADSETSSNSYLKISIKLKLKF